MTDKNVSDSAYTVQLSEDRFNIPDNKDNWPEIQAILSAFYEEYRALRAEVLQISSLMIQILQIGMTIVGVIFAASVAAWGRGKFAIEREIIVYIFYFIIPYFVLFVGILWLGEAFRFKRVGDFILIIELKIEIILKKTYEKNKISISWGGIQEVIENCLRIDHSRIDLIKPLAWEQWLKDMRQTSPFSSSGHLRLLYIARIGSWLFLAPLSFGIGWEFSHLCGCVSSSFWYMSLAFWILIFLFIFYFSRGIDSKTRAINVRYVNSRKINNVWDTEHPNL